MLSELPVFDIVVAAVVHQIFGAVPVIKQNQNIASQLSQLFET